MRPNTITFTMAAADADGVCASQTPNAGGAQSLTIAGALATDGVATFDVARHVSIASTGNDSGRTFTITGTNRNGTAITETVTGPNTTTVYSAYNYLTVTAVAVDDDTAGAVAVGSGNCAETRWYSVGMDGYEALSITINLSSGASVTCMPQFTLQNIYDNSFTEETALAAHDMLASGTTVDADTSITNPVMGIRLKVTSFASGTAYMTYMTKE